MRTLKFRIWDKLRKAFVFYGDIKEFAVELSGRGESLEFPMSIYDEEEAVFQQSTGLLDKNNKEIYEGDIIRYNGKCDITYNGLGVVSVGEFVFDREFYFYGIRVKRLDMNTYFGIGKDSSDYLVVGNIFENKELLE